jgi:hypothetical protein
MTSTAKKYVSPTDAESFRAALEKSQKATSPKALAQDAKKNTKEATK